MLANVMAHVAEALNGANTAPGHPGVPAPGALTDAAEHMLTVLRHCSTRAQALRAGPADPARATAARGFQAARAHRHLAHALDAAVALECGPEDQGTGRTPDVREDALGYQVLNSTALAQSALVTGWRQTTETRAELPSPAQRQASTAASPRRPVSAPPAAVAGVVAQTGGRRR
ncbi:hypothetical protein ACFVVX_15420 [Kitasatospora sp. NPDC058170]|uniref:hypothetical protein n=1 Tax=Kitasatospora sp. NPDC058170 TaxID=3346364 RepID=UPI0036DA9899